MSLKIFATQPFGLSKSLSVWYTLKKNTRSHLGGVTLYNEPDWSSLTLPELLEKALEFGNKGYSDALSAFAFLERALERSPKHTDLSEEIVALADKTKQAYQLLADVNHDVSRIVEEFPKTNDGGFLTYTKP